MIKFQMKKSIFLLFLFIISFSIFSQNNFSKYVNPMIGTGGHGHTFPGATVPFGMVQLSPDTRIDGSWDGCSGYHYSDSVIYGFSHTHLSGTGCSDYGDIMLMPMMGEMSFDNKIYSSNFSHANEISKAGYYKIKLNDDDIDVELTATTRVGFHKYTFNKSGQAEIILDLTHRDKLLEGKINVIDDKTIEVFRRSEAWARDQYIYARIEFSKAVTYTKSEKGDKASFSFTVTNGETFFTKVALSTVSTEGAKKNMVAELSDWDFEKTKSNAENLWNKELSKIETSSQNEDKLKIFYTALYHTMIQPNTAMDVDGMYRGRDNKIHKAEGFTYYSVFSLWDTFRAAHPLYTLIDQKRTADFINTFLAQYEQGGRLPVWELASNETDCMIGYHSVSVIADAMVKGIKGFDYEKAFQASKHSAKLDHLGLSAYKKNGFISMDDEHESVSKTLEYAYDDWCIAQMARVVNKMDDYDYFIKRSQNWKNVFDTETGFMRPKKNGGWLTPFEPREVNNNYTEGNAWQYTFFVPQDISGLISMMGGVNKFEKKLDELFTTTTKTTGREQADITGLIGQYAHGNEPSHHMTYLYNYVNKPYKTQERIHQILNDFYKPTPDGLIGNEDCGQMSAWYVLNAMGLYSVIPGGGNFAYGSPTFKDVKIHLENGKYFQISASNLSDTSFYVKDSKLTGVPLDVPFSRAFITYRTILTGGHLSFKMTSKPAEPKTGNTISLPLEPKYLILSVPTINAVSRVFDDSLLVTIKSSSLKNKMLYACVDSANETKNFKTYTKPFSIGSSKIIYAYCENKELKSNVVSGSFYKRPNNWKIKINSKYNSQYSAGGDIGIIDGLRGDANWRKGEWQGYQSQNFEAIIDLQKEQSVNKFSAGFLQDSRSWILMPTKVEYYVSTDNENFILAGEVINIVDAKDETTSIKNIELNIPQAITARYVKVKAINFGTLPQWHQGFGGDAFIFIDEISVK